MCSVMSNSLQPHEADYPVPSKLLPFKDTGENQGENISNGLLLGEESQLQKIFTADRYVALHLVSCLLSSKICRWQQGFINSLRKKLLRVQESRPGRLATFPLMETVASLPVLKIWT